MKKEIDTIRKWLLFFILALIASGLTAIPAETELLFALRWLPANSMLGHFIQQVYEGVATTNVQYPFIGYGYDWLAFAHVILAIFFIGPYQNPVRNKWVIQAGIIACVLIFPFAVIAGYSRGIPFWWRLIDCSFGVLGFIPLMVCRHKIMELENKVAISELQT